jgi:hypothetical protein
MASAAGRQHALLGLSVRDARAWVFLALVLACHLQFTRSAGAPPFWAHARVGAALAEAAAARPPPPPLLFAGGAR